jgi:hypothetical protein
VFACGSWRNVICAADLTCDSFEWQLLFDSAPDERPCFVGTEHPAHTKVQDHYSVVVSGSRSIRAHGEIEIGDFVCHGERIDLRENVKHTKIFRIYTVNIFRIYAVGSGSWDIPLKGMLRLNPKGDATGDYEGNCSS